MSFDPYGYTEPMEQAHEARESVPHPGIAPWPQEPDTVMYNPGTNGIMQDGQLPSVPQASVGGPLADLPSQVGQVMMGAAPRGIRRESQAEAMAKGALIGFSTWLVWQRMKKRRAGKAEYTSPGFRALGLLLVFPAVGLALSMFWVPESGYFVGWGCALGAASFTVYAIYRATGHGRYNSRRRGSPWRDNHRGGHRTF